MYRIRKSDLNTVFRVLGPIGILADGFFFVTLRTLTVSQLARLANAGVQVW